MRDMFWLPVIDCRTAQPTRKLRRCPPLPAVRRFNDLSSLDKIAGVQAKVDNVKGIMASNIAKALDNVDKLDDIDDKAVAIADGANKFKNSTGQLKRNMQVRGLCTRAAVAFDQA